MSAWQNYSDKFDALSQREKWLSMLVGMVIVLMVGVTYGIEPLIKENREMSRDITMNTAQLKSLEQQQQIYREALQVDPNKEYEEQLKQLQERMQIIEANFADELAELVSPAAMPALMDEVLSLSGDLKLDNMQSLEPIDVFADRPDMQGVALYQHAIQMTFTGGYKQIEMFLSVLEQTQWQVYWRTMNYDVLAHPESKLTLEFYTLSTEKELIRV